MNKRAEILHDALSVGALLFDDLTPSKTEVLFKFAQLEKFTELQAARIVTMQAEITRLKDANNDLVEALERIDEWLKVRHLGGLMPAEKALLAKAKGME